MSQDIQTASQSIDDCLTVLQQFRQDNTFDQIYARATATNGEEIQMPRMTARQRNRNNVPATSSNEYYKRAVFLPFIDTCIAQLNERFRQHAAKAYQLSALLPRVCVTRPFSEIERTAELYKVFTQRQCRCSTCTVYALADILESAAGNS